MRTLRLFFLCLLLGWPLAAQARIGVAMLKPAPWAAFHYSDKGEDVCYMLQRPHKTGLKRAKGDTLGRGDVLFMVTLRPAESLSPIVSFEAGYAFKPGSEARLSVDGASFSLFTEKDAAWARTGATDRAIAQALRKGKTLVMQGVSSKGSRSADQFDLKGAARAYKIMAAKCGVAVK